MIERGPIELLNQPVTLALFGPESVMFSADQIRVNGVDYRLRCYFKREQWGWRIESSKVGLDRQNWMLEPTDNAMTTMANLMRDYLADHVDTDLALLREAQIDKLMADRKRALADKADFQRKAQEAGALATRLFNEAIELRDEPVVTA